LYEIAHIYLPSSTGDTLPAEQYSLGIVSGRDFLDLKGVITSLVQRMGISQSLDAEVIEANGFVRGGVVQLKLAEMVLGYIGMIHPQTLAQLKLPQPAVAAELSLPVLLDKSRLVPQQQAISAFPSIQRDLNFVVAESVAWSEMENVVRAAVGNELAGVTYLETYRDESKDGPNRKRVLLSVELQRHDKTLSGQQADDLIQQVVGACREQLSADLLS
ncbi:MAG: phenylalanine--tRNA ligase subunit beta, partial [Pirellulales bacterium]|nr:phenylalanine--tRNA ligase subunit beta [Pirellulales bacterium]